MLRASLFRLIFRPPTSNTYDLGKRHIDALPLLLTAPLTPARVLVLHDDLVGVKVALCMLLRLLVNRVIVLLLFG